MASFHFFEDAGVEERQARRRSRVSHAFVTPPAVLDPRPDPEARLIAKEERAVKRVLDKAERARIEGRVLTLDLS
jgi:hypothetical protein